MPLRILRGGWHQVTLLQRDAVPLGMMSVVCKQNLAEAKSFGAGMVGTLSVRLQDRKSVRPA